VDGSKHESASNKLKADCGISKAGNMAGGEHGVRSIPKKKDYYWCMAPDWVPHLICCAAEVNNEQST
jgi:hypothetical protein